MFRRSNWTGSDDIRALAQWGPFRVIAYHRDLSATPASALHVRRLRGRAGERLPGHGKGLMAPAAGNA